MNAQWRRHGSLRLSLLPDRKWRLLCEFIRTTCVIMARANAYHFLGYTDVRLDSGASSDGRQTLQLEHGPNLDGAFFGKLAPAT